MQTKHYAGNQYSVSDIVSVYYALRLHIKILAIFLEVILKATINAYWYDYITTFQCVVFVHIGIGFIVVCIGWGCASCLDMRYTIVEPMFMEQIEYLHIGNFVRDELKAQNKTVRWLAKQLTTNRMAIYRIFASPSIDTSLLMRLSIILNKNFFALFSEKYEQHPSSM